MSLSIQVSASFLEIDAHSKSVQPAVQIISFDRERSWPLKAPRRQPAVRRRPWVLHPHAGYCNLSVCQPHLAGGLSFLATSTRSMACKTGARSSRVVFEAARPVFLLPAV